MADYRIGNGYDVHKFSPGRELWLCGIKVEHQLGLLGHSDADVALHALCDALLGAAGMRDIGYHFPDTDPDYEGADSKILLRDVCDRLRGNGWEISNADITIIAQAPKLAPHIPDMRQCIASVMDISTDRVNVKATTTEGLGFEGRKEGISAIASALIYRP